jgi:hypothetical protein
MMRIESLNLNLNLRITQNQAPQRRALNYINIVKGKKYNLVQESNLKIKNILEKNLPSVEKSKSNESISSDQINK